MPSQYSRTQFNLAGELFVADLMSSERAVRWKAVDQFVRDQWIDRQIAPPDAAIPLLIAELENDYVAYVEEMEIDAEKFIEVDYDLAADNENSSNIITHELNYTCELDETMIAFRDSEYPEVLLWWRNFVPWLPESGFEDMTIAAEPVRYTYLHEIEIHHVAVVLALSMFGAAAIAAIPSVLNIQTSRSLIFPGYRYCHNSSCFSLGLHVGGQRNISMDEARGILLDKIGSRAAPELAQFLGAGEPASSRAAYQLSEWASESSSRYSGFRLRTEKFSDPSFGSFRLKPVNVLEDIRVAARVEHPGIFGSKYPRMHSVLLMLLDEVCGDAKTKKRLQTFLSFARFGSFRQVAAENAKQSGSADEPPDHSGPVSRIRRLSESLGTALTRTSEGPGRRRTELTEVGKALADWVERNPWLID